jgi:hypothetical protein
MKTGIAILLIVVALTARGGGILSQSYNRTNNTITFKYVETRFVHYNLIRYDIRHNYYDTFTNWNATVSGTNTFTINPDEVTLDYAEIGFKPSGAYWFYIWEQTFPNPR